MLLSYFQNTDVSMTKERYFEMCELLGNEVVESEIPVDVSDFPHEIQICFHIYGLLTDMWEPMSGSYLGKDFGPVFDYFRLYSVPPTEHLYSIGVLKSIDKIRVDIIAAKVKAANPAPSASPKQPKMR